MSKKNEDISNIYKKKSEKEHILDTPDTYIGSIEKIEEFIYIYNNENSNIELKNIEYIPGLYKLFDEVIINARDHVVRIITQQNNVLVSKTDIDTEEKDKYKNVTYIKVSINKNNGIIIIENDGNGIDIIKHREHNIWIPELIFAHLRTSTNYNKNEKRIVGGKNGFGVKLVFIWSSWGKIETVDHIRKLHYSQTFENNLDKINEPIITKLKGSESKKPYTRISFIPDYSRLGLIKNNDSILTDDIISLLQKRVYDIGGVTDHSIKKVSIYYNEQPILINNFIKYIEKYIGSEKRVHEQSGGTRWEYCVSLSKNGEFTQISFVNGICTYKGGKHVDYLINQIIRKLIDYIETKKKVKVTPGSIKEQLILFLRCDIENPVFSSQTKDYLDLPSSKFGSLPVVSDNFIEKIAKLGIMSTACALTQVKEEKNAKKTDGIKTLVVRGIPNFDDAIYSGGPHSKNCILILAEGNSAKSGIISGISSDQRKYIGIFALKGKPINCRNESISKISANKEITYLKQILGLEYKKEYKDISSLRYGKVQILSDQDLDGAHIKGLIINIFDTLWPSLLKIDGFLSFMNTPILRVTPKSKKNSTLFFYNKGEIELWKNSGINLNQYEFKYLKGLGSSTAVEFKKYFEDNKNVEFIYNGKLSNDCIDKVFNKSRSNDRKLWLENHDKNSYLDTNNKKILLEEFIDKEMIHFSVYDCERSICGFDGLKISQRKTLYVAFKRNIVKEIKVAQFAASVSELSSYHHGETSLVGTIINLAQNYVGSNNINIFEPNGSFGSRIHLGEDHASERYIFTNLSPITRKIFNILDDPILEYLDDDGFSIEPLFYIPIIPYVLINGVKGIGTGFSTSIEPCNPMDVIQYVKNKLNNVQNYINDFIPYYEGFTGTIKKIDNNKYLIKGKYNIIDNTDSILITELPIYTGTDKYKEFLEELADGTIDKNGKKISPIIKDFINLSTDKIINITVKFQKGDIEKLLDLPTDSNGIDGIEKLLKLTTTVSNTNMHLFNHDLKLHKYNNIFEIIDYFMNIRLIYYEKRKNYLIDYLQQQLIRLSNKARFIQLCLNGTIDLRKKTNNEIDELMKNNQFSEIDNSYDYLIKIPMNSVSKENVERILREEYDKKSELDKLINTSLEKMWLDDLQELEDEYIKYKKSREIQQLGNNSISNSVINKKSNKQNK